MKNEWWLALNRVILQDKINNIKWAPLKKYFQDFLNLKNLVLKMLTILFSTLICALLFFLLRNWALLNYVDVQPIFNKGAAFGWGSNWSEAGVYAIKIIPCILFFGLFFFTNTWYIYVFSFLLFINSLFNVIDKSLIDSYYQNGEWKYEYNTVVDYIEFKALGFKNNVADIFICVSVVLLVIGFVYYIIKEYKKAKDDNEKYNN